MPTFWRWFGFVNFSRFAWSALMANQFSGPLGDPVWIGGQTVLEHYELKGPSLRQTHGYVQPAARTWPFVGIMAACAPRNNARPRSFRHSRSVHRFRRLCFVGVRHAAREHERGVRLRIRRCPHSGACPSCRRLLRACSRRLPLPPPPRGASPKTVAQPAVIAAAVIAAAAALLLPCAPRCRTLRRWGWRSAACRSPLRPSTWAGDTTIPLHRRCRPPPAEGGGRTPGRRTTQLRGALSLPLLPQNRRRLGRGGAPHRRLYSVGIITSESLTELFSPNFPPNLDPSELFVRACSVFLEMVLETIPARRGKAVRLAAGQRLRVVNTHGTQVVDTWAFVSHLMTEFMSMEHTRGTRRLGSDTRVMDPCVSASHVPLLLQSRFASSLQLLATCCTPTRVVQFYRLLRTQLREVMTRCALRATRSGTRRWDA